MTSLTPSGTAQLWALRMVVISCATPIPVFALVLVFVTGFEEPPTSTSLIFLLLINAIAFGLAELAGYRTQAVRPGTPHAQAFTSGLSALHLTTMLRLAITEAPVILALISVFVFTPTAWTYVIGAGMALLCMAWHGWPSARVIRRLERSLDRAGGRSGLSSLVDGAPSATPRTTI